jgi:hypothetical protein
MAPTARHRAARKEGRIMNYMLLIYSDPQLEPAPGAPGFAEMMAAYEALSADMVAAGVLRGGDGLQGVETATTLRRRAGRVETMDGPFADTKEHLGGYFVIEVPDLDAALAWAARVPSVDWGSVEVRPVMVYG